MRFGRLFAATLLLTACNAEPGNSTSDTDQPPDCEWLSGDLHLHSSHSNDALDNPVDTVIALAEERGMDYFVFTDHDNHVEGDITTWSDPDYTSDTMVMLYGTEFTTALGHANLLAAEPWDHSRIYAFRDEPGAEILDEARDLGVHVSINHPTNADPWERSFEGDYGSIEIWNAMWLAPASNSRAIALWESMLLEGRRLAARGGSDCHHQETFEADLLNVGNPTTWVYSPSREPQAIIDALAGGHATVSYAPTAERLDFRADVNGDGGHETIVGQSVETGGESVEFRIEIVGYRSDETYELVVIRNGDVILEYEDAGSVVTFEEAPPSDERTFYRVELRGPTDARPTFAAEPFYGDQIAMTNPIYFNYE